MYLQCYDKAGQRININVSGNNREALKKHVEKLGYVQVLITNFIW